MNVLFTVLGWAVVAISASFMRAEADYEAPLDNQVLMGALVQTQETSRYWVHVQAEDYTGWVNELALKPLTDREKDEYLQAPKWICTAEYSHVWPEPDASSAPLCPITMGNLLRKAGKQKGDWLPVMLPDGRSGWVRHSDVMEFEKTAGGCMACKAARAADLACRFAGTPYLWGGNSVGGFDCSGLVKLCYLMNGLLMPRNASQQVRCGTPLDPSAQDSWKKGDLLFFGSSPQKISHVAIYLGDGRIVHSSQLVRIMKLSDYNRTPVAAVRITGKGAGVQSVTDSPYYFTQNGK